MRKKYIVAVSGGVDSVVLLDMLAKENEAELVVAHFDHGIRENSAEDAAFVEELAKKYKLPFETKREELGPNASEEKARNHRYKFLKEVAARHGADIVTAHHANDVVESVAINLHRNTGWRGLAVLDSHIVRPLLKMTKQEILDYAVSHNLEWHEDHTNAEDKYLRNRLRRKMNIISPEAKAELARLWEAQVALKKDIDEEIRSFALEGRDSYDRHFFIMIDEKTALECLRAITKSKLTRPQMKGALMAIKTAKPGGIYQAGVGVEFEFSPRVFKVKMLK